MNFISQEKEQAAFLTEGDECFSLVSNQIHSAGPYVCYYANIHGDELPFALTKDGVQIPTGKTSRSTKFLTYEELVGLVNLGNSIGDLCGSTPNDK